MAASFARHKRLKPKTAKIPESYYLIRRPHRLIFFMTRQITTPPLPRRLLVLCLWLSAAAAEETGLHVEAERLREDNGVIHATGDVRVRREGYELCAANVEYDRVNGWARADGDVKLTGDGVRILSDSARYHFGERRGTVNQFDAEINDDKLHIHGESAELDGDTLSARNATVSSCPQDNQIWRLFASDVNNAQETQSLVVRDSRFEFYNIPVAYVPYASFYYGDDTRSGFLRPDIGIEDGVNVALPFYYHIADNYDWTITPKWRSQHGLEVGNEWRFLTPHSQGEVHLSAAVFDEEGRDRQRLRYQYRRGDWRLRVRADNVSDNHYLRDFSDSGDDKATRTLPRAATLEYVGDNWRGVVAAENFKSLDGNLVAPHRLLPRIGFFYSQDDGDLGWDGELQYTRFSHEQATQPEGGRWLARGEVRHHFYFTDVSLLASGGVHAVRYDNARGGDADFAVPHGRAEARWRLPFRDDNYHLRGAFIYAPTIKQDGAPLYDTELKQQNLENLYEWNRFVGGDRAADAQFIAYGAEYNAAADNKSIFFGLGQRYYFRSPRVVLASETPPKRGVSNLLLETSLQWGEKWKVDADMEWNPRNGDVPRFFADAVARFSDRRLLRAGYLSDDDDSATLSGATPLSTLVEAVVHGNYLLNGDRLSRSFFAIRVRSSCDCWRMTAKITNSLVGKNDNDIEFSFGMEFVGLGAIGSDYDKLLTAID